MSTALFPPLPAVAPPLPPLLAREAQHQAAAASPEELELSPVRRIQKYREIMGPLTPFWGYLVEV